MILAWVWAFNSANQTTAFIIYLNAKFRCNHFWIGDENVNGVRGCPRGENGCKYLTYVSRPQNNVNLDVQGQVSSRGAESLLLFEKKNIVIL